MSTTNISKSISYKQKSKLSLFLQKYLQFLKGFIPFLHHLSHDISQLCLGTLLLIGCIVAFVIFFLKNFNDARNSYYLEISSFDNNNNAIQQPNCKLIPLSITGTYLASKSGSWEGQSKFKYAEAIYNFKVVNYERTYSEYVKDMNVIYDNLMKDGNFSSHQNLGFNLLVWMTKSYLIDKTHRFSLGGSVLSVLNRDFTFGSVLNANGTCMQPVDTIFNPTTGTFSSYLIDINDTEPS